MLLNQEVIEGVSEHTGGVPLFVEEVARLLLEHGEAGGLQAIPPTLQQSLAARLDRLGRSTRSRAGIGAGAGAEISPAALCCKLSAESTTPPSNRRSTGSPTRTSSSSRSRGP